MTGPQVDRRVALAALIALAAPRAWARDDDGEASSAFAGTQLRFADVETARALLSAEDEWTRATGPFQRRAIMRSAAPVTLDAFRRWNGDAARAWPDADRQRWQRALERVAPGFAALRVPLPPQVWLVASNGQESAGAPYTRGAFVVLPGPVRVPGYSDEMLIAHELWHVAARHAPALATRLYAEIGFEAIPPLDFPAAWAERRLANPDAPENRHAMRIRIEDRTALVTPVLVAARTTLKPGESFFSVMDVRLLEVEPDAAAGVSRARLRDGEPVWHALDGPHDYLRRLGGNTGYVIHNEEAMADNVALLAIGATPRNLELLERLRRALAAPR